MVKILSIAALVMTLVAPGVHAKEFQDHSNMMDHGDGHLMDMDGAMVMGQNTDKLPGGCDKIAATEEITVHAGHKYAEKFPGRMFAFDTQEWQFEPCTKLTVHFINDDEIRHQWMMHGLPKYMYPKGMFHLEVTGPGQVSGTLIFPPGDKTYLVHCDISQHMEKGMKAQIKIGEGSGDLPSIPGITANVIQDDYSQSIPDLTPTAPAGATTPAGSDIVPGTDGSATNGSFVSGIMVIGLAVGFVLAPLLAKKFKGMTFGEGVAYVFELLSQAIGMIIKLLSGVINKFLSKKSIQLPDK
ncbi:cupredoxin domain-containing protein [Methylomarinum vadi]|uniref:cupredoxin domain-containing protein n=1 Tax=Methylomarinum vadi TaxID=438855 RepID=UPI0004DF375D|nr:multicopper oxidase [Methylomarinum vadi]